jgi:hypothetical protein
MPLYGTFTGLVVASVTAVSIGASLDSPRSLMTRQDYVEAGRTIDTEARLALARCRDLDPSMRSPCRTSAHGDERVRRAELEARYRGTVEAAAEVRLTRIRASFDAARARCSLHSGEVRTACLEDARGERLRALAEVRASTT